MRNSKKVVNGGSEGCQRHQFWALLK